MMEVKTAEIILLISLSAVLMLDLMFSLGGLLVPIALSVIISYVIFIQVQSIDYIIFAFPLILLILYFYKFSKLSRKLKSSTIEGYLNLKMLFIPIFEKLQPSEKLYFKLAGQKGYVIKKLGDNLYRVRFNIGAFGKTKFFCYSDEPLEWGNQVKIKELKDGKIYVEKVS